MGCDLVFLPKNAKTTSCKRMGWCKTDALAGGIMPDGMPPTTHVVLMRGWNEELAQRLITKEFQSGGVVYFGKQRLCITQYLNLWLGR